MNALLEMPVVFVLAISVVPSGLVAGFFFEYSVSVMLALGAASSSEYAKISDPVLTTHSLSRTAPLTEPW